MSLRTEIQDAIDEVAPPAPALESKVAALLVADGKDRRVPLHRRRSPWNNPFRGVGALVAAALVMTLLGGTILVGRFVRDLSTPPQSINQAELKTLEARPLQLPVVPTGAACPISPLTDVSAHGPEALLFGEGPVYSMSLGYNPTTSEWGHWSVFDVMVDTKVHGPILVRARELQTNAGVLFARVPFHPVGQAGDGIPTGTVVRTDDIQGTKVQAYPEVVLDTSRPYPLTKKGDWPMFKNYVGYPKAATGCVGLQIDGADFTEVVVISP